jgi:7,8-dihydro-6-hydroxymethylpterin dimethyltransferase
LHTSHTGLANLDLTNRCNMTCPVCFANANASGYLYEPDFETVRKMLQALRDQKPVAGRIVQFSGGEPTIYPRFLDVLRLAKEMGFSHTQVATNGLKFMDLEFAQQRQRSRPAHALSAVRRRLRRRVPAHARRIAVGKEAACHREREARPA